MANILRGYGLAREQGYFKQEQEADVQRRRQQLIKEGKLPPEAEQQQAEQQQTEQQQQQAAQGPGQQQAAGGQGKSFEESVHDYEVLSEVLQQQARLDDPHALRRRQWDKRVKGEPPPLSEADLMRARTKMYALGAAVGHVPRMTMGRNRYSLDLAAGGGGDLVAGVRQLSPEAREVASRTYVAGVRALVYGSLLGAIGLAAAATWATRSLDIKSGEELGDRVRQGLGPLSSAARSWMVPLKARLQGWFGPSPAATTTAAGATAGEAAGAAGEGPLAPSGGLISAMSEGGVTAEFSRRLQERYHTKPAAGAAGAAGAARAGAAGGASH